MEAAMGADFAGSSSAWAEHSSESNNSVPTAYFPFPESFLAEHNKGDIRPCYQDMIIGQDLLQTVCMRYLRTPPAGELQGSDILPQYTFLPLHLTDWERRKQYLPSNIAFDGDFGFLLVKRDLRPGICGIWFNVDVPHRIVAVAQMQGVDLNRYNMRTDLAAELRKFRWERMFLRLVIEWARQKGFVEVRVVTAVKQAFFSHARQERFHLRYDVTATREGLSRADDYHFVKF